MRVVFDLQGAQTTGSRNRGIGRYTTQLTMEIARQMQDHEVWLVLNDAFPEAVEEVVADFRHLVPKHRIRTWNNPFPEHRFADGHDATRKWMEKMREAYIKSLSPDWVHMSSLFEGLSDAAITTVGEYDAASRTSTTVFDLIPLIYKEHYLQNVDVSRWYHEKLRQLGRANCWMAISESARQDAVKHLSLPADRVFNISGAADSQFRPLKIKDSAAEALLAKFSIRRGFVLYTGGMDFRKNIPRLIEAYATLPPTLRALHQIVLVCKVNDYERKEVANHATKLGLSPNEYVLTGFVGDKELIELYNLCELFVFPSTYEGFGLPALEAMQCGAPTIASNTSSLPEVIGRADAHFDPADVGSIASKLHEVLTNEGFRRALSNHGLKRSLEFTWEKTAKSCIEGWSAAAEQARNNAVPTERRKTLAFVGPVPPQRSGIADFSAELLPELANHYDVTVFTNSMHNKDKYISGLPILDHSTFLSKSHEYERILYEFGNSSFHSYMFDLLEHIPGVVDLHDFYISGVLNYMQEISHRESEIFDKSLADSHGESSLQYKKRDHMGAVYHYPANLNVINDAVGLVLHSKHAVDLFEFWYDGRDDLLHTVIPLARHAPKSIDRQAARDKLGFASSEYVLASFGGVAETKCNEKMWEAWLLSGLYKDRNALLLFVGDDANEYASQIKQQAKLHDCVNVRFTGAVELSVYREHLQAADCAVQLRTKSRGESSASVLDCMACRLPVIVNAHGSLAEFPQSSVHRIHDIFQIDQLAEAILLLKSDNKYREILAETAYAYVNSTHNPEKIGDLYKSAIESFYSDGHSVVYDLLKSFRDDQDPKITPAIRLQFGKALARNFPPKATPKHSSTAA